MLLFRHLHHNAKLIKAHYLKSLPVNAPPPITPHLARAHRTPVGVQHPDLPAVLDLVVMNTVTGAVVAMRAAAVVASLQVKTHCVVGACVPPRLTFIYI